MVLARNAAMGFNRYIDRRIDAANYRTTQREIPAGVISPRSALIFTIANAIAFVLTTLTINKLVFFLSPVALLVILGYSYTKRFTALCHLILGLGLSQAPIGAYMAVSGESHWLPMIFSAVVLTWVAGFDIIYALQDRDFDLSNKLRSIPVWAGKRMALSLSTVLHFITAFMVIYAGIRAGFGWIYYMGSVMFIGLLIYQHSIVKPDDLSRVNRAFGTSNGIASIIFASFVLLELFL